MRVTRVSSILGALLLLAFFAVFHAGALRVYFRDDETMNLYGYWAPPLGEVAVAHLTFWSKFVRPLGALYYLPLFGIFGLNPVPFSVLRIAILLVNTVVFYYLAAWLLRSRWMALLSTFPVAYHAGMGDLAYDGAFIYDVLCGGFYFAALLYYIRYRGKHGPLGVRQTCIFLALYICALDSKEMAVSLPVIVLAYELFFEKVRKLSRLAPALLAGGLTLVYIVGKTSGEGSLAAMEAYRPVLSWARFSASNARFLNTIFCTNMFTMPGVLAAWTLLLCLGLRRRDPRWLWLLVWVVVTPLPVAFIPDRDGPEIYIVAAGWAMAAAMALRSLAWRVAREQVVVPVLRRATMALALFGCVAAYAHETRRVDRRMIPAYLANGGRTREMIRQLRAFHLQPAPHSRIVFLNDALPEGFGAEFIAYLVWNDRSLWIGLQRYAHLTEAEIAEKDYVFDYADGHLILRKSPRNDPTLGPAPIRR